MTFPPSRIVRFGLAALLAIVLCAAGDAPTKERASNKERDRDGTQEKEASAPDSNPGLLIGLMGDRELKDFGLTRERPLFTPARHPPLPPPPPPPPPPPAAPKPPKVVKEKPPTPPSLRLIGIVMTDEAELALLLDKDRNVKRLAVGDKVDGWSVAKLEASSVELRQKGERSVYRMFEIGESSNGPAVLDNRQRKNKRRRGWRR